jgi:hypothetical protein
MKKNILIILIISVCFVPAFGQTVKKMVLEKKDLSQIKYTLSDIDRVYFIEEPVSLSVSPAIKTVDGVGGTISATITSNVDSFECLSKPSWIVQYHSIRINRFQLL